MTSDRILVLAGSIRRGSVHGLLARHAAATIDSAGRECLRVDLADFEMPLYHGDLEAEQGVPGAAYRLAELVGDSGALLIASPEYNGAVTPLLKNTVDWVTRIDIGVLRDTYIGLMAASPGRLGGTRGLAMTRTWFENMRLIVHDDELSMPRVGEHIDSSTSGFDSEASAVIDDYVNGYVSGFDEYCQGVPSPD